MSPLVQSVAEHGLVEPIFVKRRNGRNEVVSGFKRWTDIYQCCEGVFDDERETIHALCICEPGINKLDTDG